MCPAVFQLWRDYFQLAKLVEGMGRCETAEEEGGEGEGGGGGGGGEPGPPAAEFPPDQQRRLFPRRPQLVAKAGRAAGRAAGGREEPSCSFCRQNGESRSVYASHRLKDEAGRVQCPILRRYRCPQCGASEDFAHTRRFCPLTQQGYTSVYTGCIRNSAGKRKKKGVRIALF